MLSALMSSGPSNCVPFTARCGPSKVPWIVCQPPIHVRMVYDTGWRFMISARTDFGDTSANVNDGPRRSRLYNGSGPCILSKNASTSFWTTSHLIDELKSVIGREKIASHLSGLLPMHPGSIKSNARLQNSNASSFKTPTTNPMRKSAQP